MTDINIGQISEALNDKMDRDVQNIDTSVGAPAVLKAMMPDYSNITSISLPYTATTDGWVSGVLTAAHSEDFYIKVNDYIAQRIYGETNQRVTAPFMIPVKKGDVVTTTGGTTTTYFYPCYGF